jgi:hypothetical protein
LGDVIKTIIAIGGLRCNFGRGEGGQGERKPQRHGEHGVPQRRDF